MESLHSSAAAFFVLLLQPAMALAQVTWSSFLPRAGHAMVHFPPRSAILLAGGADDLAQSQSRGDTWELVTGNDWTVVTRQSLATATVHHAMAYHAASANAVRFGGRRSDGSLSRQTHVTRPVQVHDGGDVWIDVTPITSPSMRESAAMAYDPVRQRTVLFGGRAGTQLLGDTWEWDGTNWQQMSPAQSPTPRYGHCMATDPRTGHVLLVCGFEQVDAHPDDSHWDWNGTNWSFLGRGGSSRPRGAFAGIAVDGTRNRVVVHGGRTAPQAISNSTYEWDGSQWSQVGTAPPELARFDHAMAFDPSSQRVILAGGANALNLFSDTWNWDGTQWRQSTPSQTPGGRGHHAMAYDPTHQLAILFGGFGTAALSDTWAWDGSAWSTLPRPALPNDPPPRADHAMSFDGAGGVLLFGGNLNNTVPANDTWIWAWNGTAWDWSPRLTNPSPPVRREHALAFDYVRRRVLLFGGRDPAANITWGDTWEWDGVRWVALAPPSSPLPRSAHAMAFDIPRAECVLFGGTNNASVLFDETWVWNGTTWSRRSPASSPGRRWGHSMTYDQIRERVILYGGFGAAGQLNDTWEWDGSNWQQRLPENMLSGRANSSLVFVAHAGHSLLFGGDQNGVKNDTWTYGPIYPARYSTFGPGCPGSAGTPQLISIGRLPWLGETLQQRMSGMVPNAPAILFLGLSSRTWNGVPLPIDLDPAGMPGCRIRVSLDLPSLLNVDAFGFASTSLPIPLSAEFLGAQLYFQFLALDAGANAFGAVFSNATEVYIGGR